MSGKLQSQACMNFLFFNHFGFKPKEFSQETQSAANVQNNYGIPPAGFVASY